MNLFIFHKKKPQTLSFYTVFTAALFPLHLVFLASAERKMLKQHLHCWQAAKQTQKPLRAGGSQHPVRLCIHTLAAGTQLHTFMKTLGFYWRMRVGKGQGWVFMVPKANHFLYGFSICSSEPSSQGIFKNIKEIPCITLESNSLAKKKINSDN